MAGLLPDLPLWAGVALAWATLAYKLARLRQRPADARLRGLSVALAAIACGLTMEFPQVTVALDRLAGMPNLSLLLGDLLTVIAAGAAAAVMARLRHPDRRARRLARAFGVAGASGLALLVGLFLLSPRFAEDPDFWASYGGAGLLVEYRAVRSAYLALCAGYLARQCWTFARSSARPSTGLGFGLLAAAGIGAELYVANDLVLALPARLGLGWLARRPSELEVLVASLALAGLTLPNWGSRLGVDAAAAWLADYRLLRRLYPLWRGICEAAPGVALVPPAGRLADLLDVRDVHFRLYRRVVEIRDGLHLLGGGRDAARPPAPEAPADLHAEALALACARFRPG